MNRHLLDRGLTYFLITTVIATVGALFYTIDHPVEEKFTECGILGLERKASGYPVEFVLQGNRVTQVGYEDDGDYIRMVKENYGKVIVQVNNHEQQDAEYHLEVRIEGTKTIMWLDSVEKDDSGQFLLKQGEKWEKQIGFAPQAPGEKVKVEFVLYKDGQSYFTEPPYLWVNVKLAP